MVFDERGGQAPKSRVTRVMPDMAPPVDRGVNVRLRADLPIRKVGADEVEVCLEIRYISPEELDKMGRGHITQQSQAVMIQVDRQLERYVRMSPKATALHFEELTRIVDMRDSYRVVVRLSEEFQADKLGHHQPENWHR
jgi:hypothetical protein